MRPSPKRAAASSVVAFALIAGTGTSHIGAQVASAPVTRETLGAALDAVRASGAKLELPPAAQFTFGDRTIAAQSRTPGPVAVANGVAHVRGSVDGDVITYSGDVIVHQGGEIHGDAIAILGKVLLDGGRVDGEVRSLSGDVSPPSVSATRRGFSTPGTVASEAALAAGWFAVLIVVGIGVLVLASSNLNAVSEALERNFTKALLAGIAAQLAFAPVLALLLVGLVLTLLGILLIPFAVVAYVLATAGLVTLGYLAIANIVGRSFVRAQGDGDRERRAAALRAVIVGLTVLMAPWFVAAGLAWSPTGVAVARAVAVAVTWVACSAGLGAALISRGGARRVAAPLAQHAMAAASWQTPTPVSGVVAARRPTPLATPRPK
ncbi:MAG: hypothetical protein ACHQQ3_05255 [Gemmatimonadales bacterium]